MEGEDDGGPPDPVRPDVFGFRVRQPRDRLQDPATDHDFARSFPSCHRIDQPRPADLEVQLRIGHAATRVPARRYRTAIRTATPFVTWSVITDCGPAATSAAISTPSFIGPR